MIKKSLLFLIITAVQQSSPMLTAVKKTLGLQATQTSPYTQKSFIKPGNLQEQFRELKKPHRINQYLQSQKLVQETKNTKIQAVLNTLQSFNALENHDDAITFNYALWRFSEESTRLLNSNKLKIKLPAICKKLEKEPSLNNTSCRWRTFSRSFSDEPVRFAVAFSHLVELYGIVKFVGQYTNKQKQFDQCATIVSLLNPSPYQPILDPRDTLFLINQNKQFGNSYYPKQNIYLHKKEALKKSIYTFNPSFDKESSIVTNLYCQKLIALNNKSAKIVLIQELLKQHLIIPTTIDDLFHTNKEMEDLILRNGGTAAYITHLKEFTKNLLQEMKNLPSETPAQTRNRINESALQLIKGLTRHDMYELGVIIDNALIYTEDNFADKENYTINKIAFLSLFTSQLIKSDSELAHYSIRKATECDRLWAIKFLVSQGVTVNPPMYTQKQALYWVPLQQQSLIQLALLNGNKVMQEYLLSQGAHDCCG
jgi:hypothetical protein